MHEQHGVVQERWDTRWSTWATTTHSAVHALVSRPMARQQAVSGACFGTMSEACHARDMTHLLVIHHSPTGSVQKLLDAALRGAHHPDIEGVEVTSLPALAWARGEADETTIQNAAGYLFLTPANFGYMSGALKHVFDSTFLKIGGTLSDDGSAGEGSRSMRGRPYGLIVHGRYDTTGAVRSVEGIVGALGWRLGGEVLESMGDVTDEHLAAAEDLGATIAIQLVE